MPKVPACTQPWNSACLSRRPGGDSNPNSIYSSIVVRRPNHRPVCFGLIQTRPGVARLPTWARDEVASTPRFCPAMSSTSSAHRTKSQSCEQKKGFACLHACSCASIASSRLQDQYHCDCKKNFLHCSPQRRSWLCNSFYFQGD